MYVSATDWEKLGQITASVYTSSTEDVLAFLLFMYAEISCFASVGHCNPKTIFSVYGVLDKPIEEKYRYAAYRQFVRWCRGYLGKKQKKESLSLLVLQLSLGKNLILLTLLD